MALYCVSFRDCEFLKVCDSSEWVRTSLLNSLSSLSSSSHSQLGPSHRSTMAHRMACLQRLAGTDPVSLRSWSVQRVWGRPGRRLQSPPSERPDARPTWQCRAGALCALWYWCYYLLRVYLSGIFKGYKRISFWVQMGKLQLCLSYMHSNRTVVVH